jgi:hypothetical protein
MADETRFDADELQEIGTAVQGLMAEHQRAVAELESWRPNAGSFATAEWLETLIGDRRDAVVQHGERLNTMLDQMGADLRAVGKELAKTDDENADKLVKIVKDGRGRNADLVDDYSARTEEDGGHGDDDFVDYTGSKA